MAGSVFILGSLDTQDAEVEFLRKAVPSQGGEPLVVDTGALDEPITLANVTRSLFTNAAAAILVMAGVGLPGSSTALPAGPTTLFRPPSQI